MPENPLQAIQKLDPELTKVYGEIRQMAFNDGALPRKYKILIALALDANHGVEAGVAALAKQAIESGATKEEIKEAIRIAYVVGGGACLFTASAALKEVV